MSVRPDHEGLASRLAEPLPHSIPIKHDIFTFFESIAKRERTSAAVVINDVLRKYSEGVG